MRPEKETNGEDQPRGTEAYIDSITSFALQLGLSPEAARMVAESMEQSSSQNPPLAPTQPSPASLLEDLSEQLQGINLDPNSQK